MESSNCTQKIRALFCETANSLAQLFKESLALDPSTRLSGYRDGYKDVLDWAKGQSEAGLKNVSVGILATILSEKIEACNKVQYQSPEALNPSSDEQRNMIVEMSDIAVSKGNTTTAAAESMMDSTGENIQARKVYRCKRILEKGAK